MKDPETRKRMADFGLEPIGNTPEEFGAFVKEDIARWAKLVKEIGAKSSNRCCVVPAQAGNL